jgi:hypothetical protein
MLIVIAWMAVVIFALIMATTTVTHIRLSRLLADQQRLRVALAVGEQSHGTPGVGDYAVALQRAIEAHCRGEEVPPEVRKQCPHFAGKLDAALLATRPIKPPA